LVLATRQSNREEHPARGNPRQGNEYQRGQLH
jgi:hypothetical protein